MKRVVVVGSSGQDGQLLCERLVAAGCDVTRIARTSCDVDILQREAVFGLLRGQQPDEVYYLAAFHHSSEERLQSDSYALFEKSFAVHVTGLLNFLDGIKTASHATKLFYAASSHVFGRPTEPLQNERTPLHPTSPYGITKAAGVHCCRYFRDQCGVFASVGILYNHESPHRSEKFLSQKIISTALRILRGEQAKLILGDLEARIDWGYAPDFADAMIRILNLTFAADFVIATGHTHTVREFVEIAFDLLGLNWENHVEEDRCLLTRENVVMTGDASKLRNATGWQPSVSFGEMIATLIDARRNGP